MSRAASSVPAWASRSCDRPRSSATKARLVARSRRWSAASSIVGSAWYISVHPVGAGQGVGTADAPWVEADDVEAVDDVVGQGAAPGPGPGSWPIRLDPPGFTNRAPTRSSCSRGRDPHHRQRRGRAVGVVVVERHLHLGALDAVAAATASAGPGRRPRPVAGAVVGLGDGAGPVVAGAVVVAAGRGSSTVDSTRRQRAGSRPRRTATSSAPRRVTKGRSGRPRCGRAARAAGRGPG